MLSTFGLPELVILTVVAGVTVVPASLICAKAGYSRWLGALAVVPIANVLLAFFLAFVEWPIERQLKASRSGPGPAN